MRRANRFILFVPTILLVVLCCFLSVHATPPMPTDFAYGCDLVINEETGIYLIDLPLEVYERIQQNDASDLQVFNNAGLPVPQALRHRPLSSDPVRKAVPFFPLPATDRQAPSQDLSVRVQRQANGSILTINTGHLPASASDGCSYLLDLSTIVPAPHELEMQWRTDSNDTEMYTVSIQDSNDLVHWQPVGHNMVLADLAYNGATISRHTLSLPRQVRPYLRLDCRNNRQPLRLTAVTGTSGPAHTADQWHWQELNNDTVHEKQGQWVIEYQVHPKIRVTALDLVFPVPNSLARATIESRPSVAQPWHRVAQGDFYRLDLQGTSFHSPLVPCAAITAPWWQLTIAAAGSSGVPGKEQLPRLSLGWVPDELLFLGRGQGPYTLAFGSSKVDGRTFAQASLVLSALHTINRATLPIRITPGPVRLLGGEQALRPSRAPIPWQRVLLWAVLVVGVALLALMARSVYREMQRQQE